MLIFFVFIIVFSLELETRLYYYGCHYGFWEFSCTNGLLQDAKINFKVNINLWTLIFDNFLDLKKSLVITLPSPSVTQTHCVQKLIRDWHLRISTNNISWNVNKLLFWWLRKYVLTYSLNGVANHCFNYQGRIYDCCNIRDGVLCDNI